MFGYMSDSNIKRSFYEYLVDFLGNYPEIHHYPQLRYNLKIKKNPEFFKKIEIDLEVIKEYAKRIYFENNKRKT